MMDAIARSGYTSDESMVDRIKSHLRTIKCEKKMHVDFLSKLEDELNEDTALDVAFRLVNYHAWGAMW